LSASIESALNPAASSEAALAFMPAAGEPNLSINSAAVREPTPVMKLSANQSRSTFSFADHMCSLGAAPGERSDADLD
jgi:hypothetical protein